MTRMTLAETVLNLLFPSRCVNCEKHTEGRDALCADCCARIDVNTTLFCGHCRARLPEGKKICHARMPYLLGAAANYDDSIVRNAIHALKFRFIKKSGDALGNLLAQYVDSVPALRALAAERGSAHTVVPIPLSAQRLRQRGFNQSEIIARAFARSCGIPIVTDCLIRIRDTKPQSESKHVAERLRNVEGCFSAAHKKPLESKHLIILIDDVITSGATMRAAAEALQRAGAWRILALVAAQA